MSAFKSELEKEHVMHQLVLRNRPIDMANFFVFTDDVTTEDIFEFYYISKPDFFIKVFKYVFTLMKEAIARDKFEKVAGSIIQRIYLDEFVYHRKITERFKTDRSMILSVFLENLLTYLALNSEIKGLLFAISIINNSDHITPMAVKGIVTKDKIFANEVIIKELATSFTFSTEDIISIMFTRFEYSTDEDMYGLLQEIFYSEDEILKFIGIISDKFSYRSSSKRVRVTCLHKGRLGRFYKFIREYLTETILPLVELDIREYMESGYYTYVTEKDGYRSDIYMRLSDWLDSDERKSDMITNFHVNGHEDPVYMISEEQHTAFSCDVETIKYKYVLPELDSVKLFTRAFNLNRFNFFTWNGGRNEIRDIFKEIEESNIETLMLAIDPNIYNFLMNY